MIMNVDIEKLANLARIRLNESEKEKLQKEFEAILGYFDLLKEADVSGVDLEGKLEAVESGGKKANQLREDGDLRESDEFSEELLKSAPSVKDGYVKVKHVFD